MNEQNVQIFTEADLAVNEDNLASELNHLYIKKNVNVKWSENIIDNENFNHNSKIHKRKKTPIKRKNKNNNNKSLE